MYFIYPLGKDLNQLRRQAFKQLLNNYCLQKRSSIQFMQSATPIFELISITRLDHRALLNVIKEKIHQN